ncbi:T6SS immunity protein Tli4 family protein [Variovorax sp. GB1P17]|uniref:T6SS immunity protein Tli4 family protein n=1 Tax=Variovorax sp. GB1P17 TaxID=3443740 RepID=UPI003F47A321
MKKRDAVTMLSLMLICALAHGPVYAQDAAGVRRTECVGYQTIEVPGDIEYATLPPNISPANGGGYRFDTGAGVWKTYQLVDSEGVFDADESSRSIHSSSLNSAAGLQSQLLKLNRKRQQQKDIVLDHADMLARHSDMDPGGKLRQADLDDAAAFRFYQPYDGGNSFGFINGSGKFNFSTLVGNHVVSASRKLEGTPEQTIAKFLKFYRARMPFEIPSEPGVCLPYGFMTGEKKPAYVAVSFRLTNRPDIVVYLSDKDASGADSIDPEKFVNEAVQRGYFYGAKLTEPLDGRMRPLRPVNVDGRKGLGGMALITRDVLSEPPVHNEANKNQDWGYLAYIPGDKNAPPGTSSNLIFKVERFGRFAKTSMTENEFRDLVKNIAQSIKRRPGAWRAS